MADRTDDGIRVIVDAVERPSFSLEPSITKTLRSPDWMGDLTLEDKNWKGTAQKIAVSIRKRLEEDVPCFR
jgi:outer membrane protein assembly factor BamA